ncbi:MAG TPA: tRNA guanosine(34) transglycosylase Tgt [Alphaproteobacteria bacterium]|nr:tRNA guanosine(34) transglycosylase Tgt [Alphaproteobacteria bacterium]
MSFALLNKSSSARAGILKTAHGDIETPVFMPVGTAATVKAMTVDDLHNINAQIILGNTYHLMLRPGSERLERLGGLHKFMNWNKPILTDSGGFQVMSLSKIRKLTEQGVEFQSHVDGTKYMLSPERSMEIQHQLGSDITMIFDECTPYPATHTQAKESMELSLRWAERSKKAFKPREGYHLFGIVQGSVYEDLRKISASQLKNIGFDGYAIGGLAVGEGQEAMFKVLDYITDELPKDKPRYLMGVGKPLDILGAVARGIDMFDCVLPTRNARNGQIYTKHGALNLSNAKFADDNTPIDKYSKHKAANTYSKAYLHHLLKCDEILASMLLTQVNLGFYLDMMVEIREAIKQNKFQEYYNNFVQFYSYS